MRNNCFVIMELTETFRERLIKYVIHKIMDVFVGIPLVRC